MALKISFAVALSLLTGSSAQNKTALLLIDVQDCFTSNGGRTGSLSVANAIDIVPLINQLRADKACLFDEVFMSQDFHPLRHISFASTHNISFSTAFDINAGTNTIALKCLNPSSNNLADASCCLMDPSACAEHGCTCDNNPACGSANPACVACAANASQCFDMTQSLWPDHCGSWTSSEAGNDASLVSTLTLSGSETIVQKGSNQLVDAYSAFMDNTKTLRTSLHSQLQTAGITKLYIAGIATDFCVSWTATDAVALGYETVWISDASKGIVTNDLTIAGMTAATVADLVAMTCTAPTPAPTVVVASGAITSSSVGAATLLLVSASFL